jgi:hypothetical protein
MNLLFPLLLLFLPILFPSFLQHLIPFIAIFSVSTHAPLNVL